MPNRQQLGGVIHTYQKYDPKNIPSPTQPPPDMVSGAMEHMLAYGSLRELTEEELARAIHLDPSQIAGLGPSIEALREMLLERKRRILERYETKQVRETARREYRAAGEQVKPPKPLRQPFDQALEQEQLRDLERLWYKAGGERSAFSAALLPLIERLGEKYQVDELAAKYEFTGRTPMSVPQALAIKEELETIDRLLKQLEEAAKTAQVAVIDIEELSKFAEPGQIDELNALAQQIEDYVREMAERQGLERTRRGFQLTPKALRIFQGKLLDRIFSQLQASRSGRHQVNVGGEGAVELERTKAYEFGDSVANMDVPASFTNALIRCGPGLPVRMRGDDIVIHRTRNTPKCATVVVMDMSGSMRYGGLYVNVKRMGLALDGLIRREYPGDFLQFVEMYTFARPRSPADLVHLMPKPVTIYDPEVALRADMSREDISEFHIPPHFTNIQHGLQLARKFLAVQPTPNRQVILITDGLPTAHFEGSTLYLLYPPDPRTEAATLREGLLCRRDGVTLNIFLLQSWSQSIEDVRFAHRLAESTKGRVFFTAGRDLDRYVVWDYVQRRRAIVS
ncbi:MAG TPA: hypothetical protein VG125_10715 [Pirellulales bacterium]|jgi:uncharacterized protein with von Willebrand factor type A (vWA) domain|nr:hypothetical protein [Pirellulales bacterium]